MRLPDLNFRLTEITVWDGTGAKDRVSIPLEFLKRLLRQRLENIKIGAERQLLAR